MRHGKKRSGAGLAVVLPLAYWSLYLADAIIESEALSALADLPGALKTSRTLRDRMA